ncbi:hypothetical protein Q7P37_003966 [Cladosporium fusiforme]
MSQDLFAAFGEAEKAPPKRSGPASHNPAGPPKPLDMDAILNAKPYDEFATAPVPVDDDDDEFGDFEDASPMDEETRAAILKARMGSPLLNQDMPFFDTTPVPSTLPSKPKQAPKPVSNLPFKPKPAEHINIPASSNKSSASSSRTASKPVSNLPFKPKPAQGDPKAEIIGQHPFAGRMDMLFADDDDEYDAGADDLNIDLANDPEAAMAYSKKLIADSMAHEKPQMPGARPVSRTQAPTYDSKPTPNKLQKKPQYASVKKDANVLFDADNVSEDEDEDDDGWGTFESSSANPSKEAPAPLKFKEPTAGAFGIDMLGLEDTSAQWASSDAVPKTTASASQPHRQPVLPPQDDDAWDDFEAAAPAPTQPKATASALQTSTINIAAPADPANAPSLPPTNIPPPAILLSIFPSLIASAQSALFDTLAKVSHDQKQELLSHPATHQFLRGFIGLSTVLAHIIAGRKQRWKRDQFLAQGMRIGPAAAGGKGGMKLAGVDKSEVAKEDREVLDAVRQWRSIVGKLRSAVVGANGKSSTKLPPVPEISEQMPVKTLKSLEGGIVAPHACALCGLKREERVPKVDESVDDSFGEWWVQGMNMHLLCKNFWDEHSEKMRSR